MERFTMRVNWRCLGESISRIFMIYPRHYSSVGFVICMLKQLCQQVELLLGLRHIHGHLSIINMTTRSILSCHVLSNWFTCGYPAAVTGERKGNHTTDVVG